MGRERLRKGVEEWEKKRKNRQLELENGENDINELMKITSIEKITVAAIVWII